MNRRHFLKNCGIGFTGLAFGMLNSRLQAAERKPNILFIMADDLDKEWISCYGSEEIETPNIDRLAASGMQFENAYSMPQCTPSRATLLTGQYPYNNGWIYHWDVPRWGAGCHFDWKYYTTFARILRDAGYATAAAGKWQINDFRIQPEAMVRHGFDEYCMWTGGEGGNPKSDIRYRDPYIHTKSGSRTYKGAFGPDLFTDFLIDFMEQNRDRPLMMYYPMVLPHSPLVSTPLDPDAETDVEKHKAMVRYVDHLVGRLVSTLKDLNLRENTIILFTTDNGTSGRFTGTRNGREVRGGKSYSTENGVNVPFIVNCPGMVPEGVRTNALTDFTDLLPTFADLAGTSIPEDLQIDGISIADHILGRADDTDREWILAMGSHPGAMNEDGRVVPVLEFRDRVIRDKQYKLYVDIHREGQALFNVASDPAEEHNLIESHHPAVKAALSKFQAVIQALPKHDAAPKYDKLPPQSWDVKPEGRWLVENARQRMLQREPDWQLR